MPSDALSDEVTAAYRKLMNDPNTPPHLVLGAANRLSAHLATQGAEPTERPRDDTAPDPMAFLDDMEQQRRKRARR